MLILREFAGSPRDENFLKRVPEKNWLLR